MSASHLIARQPIYNESLKVIGYELLYRMSNNEGNTADISNSDSATIDVLLAAYNDLCISDVVGKKLAFVNFTSNLLSSTLPPISPKQLVIELLEDQEITPELIKRLKQLRKKGYKIALDDFDLNKETLSLIECADIIKLDVLEQSLDTWKNYIPKLTERGITMLAEKVETHEVYEKCRHLGFTLFQGYFFSKPKILSGKRMSRNEMSVINLIGKLNSENVNYNEVIQLISSDVDLSYNLLRTVNSGMYALRTQVDSIKQAAVILGLAHLKNWINFLALSSLENKPQLLMDTALVRAKMCELVGEKITRKEEPDGYFTVGLFSILEAFFDIPLKDLLKKLSLNKELTQALMEHKGPMGKTLSAVIMHQSGELDKVESSVSLDEYGVNAEQITQCHLDSIKWSDENAPSAS